MFKISSILNPNNDSEAAITNGPTTCKPPKFQAQLPPPTSFVRRPRTTTSSSLSSSPPNTPPLLRSDSQDSSTMNGTPSPVTPTFNEYGQPQHKSSPSFEQSTGPYFAGSAGSAPLPEMSQMPFAMSHQAQQWYPQLAAGVPAQMLQQQHAHASTLLQQHQPQPTFAPASSAQDSPVRRASTSSNKKNSKYPCPLAAQYSCPDMFTTSGHAARHAKKHTGKKDAVCPDCGKAFTRKDNMEQHRRTHKNGKTPSKSSDESSQQPKKQKLSSSKSKPRPAPLQTDVDFSQTAHGMVDPALPLSPSSSYGGLPTGQLPLSGMYTMSLGSQSAYPDPTGMSGYSPQMSMMHGTGYTPTTPGMTVGLDTLALAATSSDEDLKRKFSEDS